MSTLNTEPSPASLPKSPFTLSDAVTLYQKQVDHTHRLWNYLWLVSSAILAAVGFSGNAGKVRSLWPYLLAGFIAFAVSNCCLMFYAHRDARTTALAIQEYTRQEDVQSSLAKEFRPILLRLSRLPEGWPLVGHMAIDISVVVLILLLAYRP